MHSASCLIIQPLICFAISSAKFSSLFSRPSPFIILMKPLILMSQPSSLATESRPGKGIGVGSSLKQLGGGKAIYKEEYKHFNDLRTRSLVCSLNVNTGLLDTSLASPICQKLKTLTNEVRYLAQKQFTLLFLYLHKENSKLNKEEVVWFVL